MKSMIIGVVAVAIAGVGAPVQAADGGPSGTIVYTKDLTVWAIPADGSSGPRQLTANGTPESNYGSPSLNDAGSLLTVRGPASTAQQYDPKSGKLLNSGIPYMDRGGLPSGLAEVVANPAGNQIAYSYLTFSGYPSWTTGTCVGITEPGATVNLRNWCGLFTPNWWNEKLIVSNGRDVGIADPMSASGPTVILLHDGDLSWTAGEVTRAGDAMLVVGSTTTDDYLDWVPLARSGNSLTVKPTGQCTVPASKPQSPSFSPDGAFFVWENSDGVAFSAKPDGVTSDGICTFAGDAQPQLLVPGGSSPSWSAAQASKASVTRVIALPAKAKGAQKVVSKSPKVCKIVGKGKKTKVKVLRNGRCKLKVTRAKKTKMVVFKVTA